MAEHDCVGVDPARLTRYPGEHDGPASARERDGASGCVRRSCGFEDEIEEARLGVLALPNVPRLGRSHCDAQRKSGWASPDKRQTSRTDAAEEGDREQPERARSDDRHGQSWAKVDFEQPLCDTRRRLEQRCGGEVASLRELMDE